MEASQVFDGGAGGCYRDELQGRATISERIYSIAFQATIRLDPRPAREAAQRHRPASCCISEPVYARIKILV